MITEIQDLPPNVAGFKAVDQVSKEDFTNVVMPRVKALAEQEGEINYLLVIETPLSNFSFQSWMQDAWMGMKHLMKWNRVAIVSDKESIRTFTDIFSKFIPGEFRGYEPAQLQQAVVWLGGSEAR